MAWRLNKAVVRGEIDNRTKGTVTGKIWLVGAERPIVLELEGNCWRDIAGCLLRFQNPHPEGVEKPPRLSQQQSGLVGDMTASRKVWVLDVPAKEAYRMKTRGEKPPEHMDNCIYLEWYSNTNGRVVIESVDYRVEISEPTWLMGPDEERAQRKANDEAISTWMERLTGTADAAQRQQDESTAWVPADEAPMDEFRWEKFLKESDKRTDKMMELYERYDGVEAEERARLIAREMGWAHVEEYLDAEATNNRPETGEWSLPDLDDIPYPQPDPLRRGIDWVVDDGGHLVHPLYLQCYNLVFEFHDQCKTSGFLDEAHENPLDDLILSGHMISAKLAGALNSIWMDRDPDCGFIVAYLKRSLKYFNEAMGLIYAVQQQRLVPAAVLDTFHSSLCSIREDTLKLMDKYRAALGE